LEGVWHTSIVCGKKEYFFGGGVCLIRFLLVVAVYLSYPCFTPSVGKKP